MRILAIVQGTYGKRIAENIESHLPDGWRIATWTAPPVLPPVIDYPEEYLPDKLPAADLVLALGEHPGVAELLPDIVALCRARAVIAPVDNVSWMPPGLMRQVERWLHERQVAVVFPKPFCSLTEDSYGVGRRRVDYQDPIISEFARRFGSPRLQITCRKADGAILNVRVMRDSPCGCARYVAEHLVGAVADDAEQTAGLLHHHYPCLASMGIDPEYNDTLMHVSGNIMKREVAAGVALNKSPPLYLRPSGLSK
jgi:hypothetical protein